MQNPILSANVRAGHQLKCLALIVRGCSRGSACGKVAFRNLLYRIGLDRPLEHRKAEDGGEDPHEVPDGFRGVASRPVGFGLCIERLSELERIERADIPYRTVSYQRRDVPLVARKLTVGVALPPSLLSGVPALCVGVESSVRRRLTKPTQACVGLTLSTTQQSDRRLAVLAGVLSYPFAL
ncbi:MAG: hypothetical protein AAF500_16385 [Myxococcota bacterium]